MSECDSKAQQKSRQFFFHKKPPRIDKFLHDRNFFVDKLFFCDERQRKIFFTFTSIFYSRVNRTTSITPTKRRCKHKKTQWSRDRHDFFDGNFLNKQNSHCYLSSNTEWRNGRQEVVLRHALWIFRCWRCSSVILQQCTFVNQLFFESRMCLPLYFASKRTEIAGWI